MITINAINVAKAAMAEAIERYFGLEEKYCPVCGQSEGYYESEELVARGQVLPLAEDLAQNTKASK